LKNFRISESVLSNDNLTYEEASRQDVGGSCSDKTKNVSELHQKENVPLAIRRLS
jgi:hypothetical protein